MFSLSFEFALCKNSTPHDFVHSFLFCSPLVAALNFCLGIISLNSLFFCKPIGLKSKNFNGCEFSEINEAGSPNNEWFVPLFESNPYPVLIQTHEKSL